MLPSPGKAQRGHGLPVSETGWPLTHAPEPHRWGARGFRQGAVMATPPPGPDSETADELPEARTHLSFEVLGCPGQPLNPYTVLSQPWGSAAAGSWLGGLQSLSQVWSPRPGLGLGPAANSKVCIASKMSDL